MITLKYDADKDQLSLDKGEGFVDIGEEYIPEFVDEIIVVEKLNRKQIYELVGFRNRKPKRYIIEDNPVEDV